MLEMPFFALQIKILRVFDEKDGVACVKTEPFKARFVDFSLVSLTQNDK